MARRLALVTGASAGIGEAMARLLAEKGYDLALVARRGERLEALAGEIEERSGVETLTLAADLADPAAPAFILDRLADHGRAVDCLVNNAGYSTPGAYAASDWPTHAALLQVMLQAPAELAHRVLPGMLARGFGRIVNVASLAGLIPGAAGHTLYGPTKAFLIRFSQGLHLETLGAGVHVTALCPGFTLTEFHDANGQRERVNAAVPGWMWMGAEEVAAAGYAAMEANRPICVPGAPNKVIAALAHAMPDDWALALAARHGARFRQA